MSLKNIFASLLFSVICGFTNAQIITIEDFIPEGVSNFEINVINKSVKLTVVVFRKQSFQEELNWLTAKHIENLDTFNVRFVEIVYPEDCPQSTRNKRPITIDNISIIDYPLINKMGSSFHVIIIPTNQNIEWMTNKIGTQSINNLSKHYPLNSKKQKKGQTPDYYEFNDLNNFKNQFVYLVSNTADYQNIRRVEVNFQDSFNQLLSYVNNIDSINNNKRYQTLSFEVGAITSNFSTQSKQPTTINSTQYHLRQCRYINSSTPIIISAGFGLNKLNFNSFIQYNKLNLGNFIDIQGDIYKSDLLDFQSTENVFAKNYNLELGIQFQKMLIKAQNNSLHSNADRIQIVIHGGVQFTINSKPEIYKSNIEISNNLTESRQYPILNFDYILYNTTAITKIPDNFRSYHSINPNIGIELRIQQRFHIQTNLFYTSSTNISSGELTLIKKESDKIIYSPITFSQPKLSIQSFGFAISLGYDLL